MTPNPRPRADRAPRVRALPCVPLLVAVLLVVAAMIPGPAGAQDGWQPVAGDALVIAQGVSSLPAGDVAWRTVRGRAAPPGEAEFVPRSLGFVVATAGPLLLVDGERGEQVRLGPGEAAFVREGVLQQRASLSGQPVGYLAIELAAADAPPPAAGETVLQPGVPFAAPDGLRDIDLLAAVLSGDRTLDLADSGTRNVVLVTAGAAIAGPPEGGRATLLAGEAAGFSGPLVVAAAGADPGQSATVVVAAIGPSVPAPADPLPNAAPSPNAPVQAPATPNAVAADEVVGSITVQVFGCPAGMTPETVIPGACVPVADAAEVVLTGATLPAPLTLADATATAAGFAWKGLPAGDYALALAVLPDGYVSWTLAAPGATGDPVTGFRVGISPRTPDLSIRIFAFPEA